MFKKMGSKMITKDTYIVLWKKRCRIVQVVRPGMAVGYFSDGLYRLARVSTSNLTVSQIGATAYYSL